MFPHFYRGEDVPDNGLDLCPLGQQSVPVQILSSKLLESHSIKNEILILYIEGYVEFLQ